MSFEDRSGDRHPSLEGYYRRSPWPCPDGAPTRAMTTHLPGPDLSAGELLTSTTRWGPYSNLVLLRDPGEVYLQGLSLRGDQPAWVEQIDGETLRCLRRSPDLETGGGFWSGGMIVHRNGFLYVVQGNHVHKLSPDLELDGSRQLPEEQAYNGLIALRNGVLAMKNLPTTGGRSRISLVDPDTLELCGGVDVAEPVTARLSYDGRHVYAVGHDQVLRYADRDGELSLDPDWSYTYRIAGPYDQSYGWAANLAADRVWFMDNGETRFDGGAIRGVASGPVHLIQVPMGDARGSLQAPFDLPYGAIISPPHFDPRHDHIVVFDSANRRLGAFRFCEPGRLERKWQHRFGTSLHVLQYLSTDELIVNDFDRQADYVVVLDAGSGEVRGRAATGSTSQSVLYLSPGWDRDVYYCSGQVVTRVAPAG